MTDNIDCVVMQDNFKKVMEVRKKLIGDSEDTLITPCRVSAAISNSNNVIMSVILNYVCLVSIRG